MKNLWLLGLSLFLVAPCFSQERPRIFVNFDTVRVVEVYVPTPTAIEAKARKNNRKSPTVDQKLNKKTAMVLPVKRSVTRDMNVSEGLADREAPNPIANR